MFLIKPFKFLVPFAKQQSWPKPTKASPSRIFHAKNNQTMKAAISLNHPETKYRNVIPYNRRIATTIFLA